MIYVWSKVKLTEWSAIWNFMKWNECKRVQVNKVNEVPNEEPCNPFISFNPPFNHINAVIELSGIDWMKNSMGEWAINFSQFTFIQWNEWINWRNVTRMNRAQQLQLIASIHHARWSVNEWALMDCKRKEWVTSINQFQSFS